MKLLRIMEINAFANNTQSLDNFIKRSESFYKIVDRVTINKDNAVYLLTMCNKFLRDCIK